MTTPLTATARIITRYSINGFIHRLVQYCAYNVVLGTNQLVDRDGITTILWTLAATYQWNLLRAHFSAAVTPATATATLESRSGALWNPVEVYLLTGAGTNTGGYFPAQQATWVLRDTLFKKLRYMIFEGVANYVFHSQTGGGYSAATDAISLALNGGDTNASAMYRWMKSRGDRFLLATGDIAGLTFDLNDKIKRARQLE